MNYIPALIEVSQYILILILSIAVYRIYTVKNRIYTMAGNWAAHMGEKSGKVRHEKASSKQLASGQAKILDTIAAQVPGAASILKSSGVSDDEAWALITDPNTMKGIKVIMETLGGVTKFLDKSGDGQKKKSRKAGNVPLIAYKHGT